MAPDSNSASGWPPGPLGSMMAGILLLGLSERNSGDSWSWVSKLTRCGSYGRPVSSSMIATLTPLGVGKEYSCSRSGCWAGHLWVMGKVERLVMGSLSTARKPRVQRARNLLRVLGMRFCGHEPYCLGYGSWDAASVICQSATETELANNSSTFVLLFGCS